MAKRSTELALSGGATLVTGAIWLAVPMPIVGPVIALAPVCAVIAFRSTFLLALLFVIFSFFRIHEVFPALGPLRIPLVLAAATLSGLVWRMFATKEIKPYWTGELSWFTAFFVWASIGVIFAVSRPTAFAFWAWTYWKIAVMTFALAWLLRRPEHFTLFARAVAVAGAAVAAVAIANKFHGIGLVEGTRVTIGRDIGSVLGDPNDLSLVLLFPLGFAISLIVFRNGFISGLIGFSGTILIVWAIIATQSRGGLLGIMAVFGVFGLRIVKSKIVLIAAAGIAALALFTAAGISTRQSGGAAEEGIDESSMGRIYAWQAAWNMALSRPITGVGLDNFVGNYYYYTPSWDGRSHAVHSTWFNVLSETGFPGMFLFLAMAIKTAVTAYKSMRGLARDPQAHRIMRAMSVAVFAGLIGFFVAGTFLTQGFTWPVYILLALTAAIKRYRTELASGDY